MKKCLIIPDSFKGSINSAEICKVAESAASKVFPNCKIITVPISDGGEGMVDSFLQGLVHAERVELEVLGPYAVIDRGLSANKSRIIACYAREGDTAYIEMAQTSGLHLVEDNPDPSITTTFGVGQTIRHAVEHGCRKIILGLGGSCTNDAGTGAVCALGAKFYDDKGLEFIPTGGNLSCIASYDVSEMRRLLHGCNIIAMCDIDNPMYGLQGAAYVFAPQKGADHEMVQQLDLELRAFAKLVTNIEGVDYTQEKGSGAAGAFGFGVVALLGGQLRSGIEVMLDQIGFEDLASNADLIVTGEGRIDGQSLRGKAVIGIARRASQLPKPIPVLALVGSNNLKSSEMEQAYSMGVSSIICIQQGPRPYSEARLRAAADIESTLLNIFRLLLVTRC